MNDISVKIVESLKEQPTAAVSPVVPDGDNEVDPLALEEGESGGTRNSFVEDIANGDNDKAGNCDENAKEEKLSEIGNEVKDNLVALEAKKIKEELLKEDSSSLESLEEEIQEKETLPIVAETVQPEPAVENGQALEAVVTEPESVPSVKEPVEETPCVTIKRISPAQTPKLKEPTPPKEVPVPVPDSVNKQMKVEPEEEMMDVVQTPEKPKEPEPKVEKPEPNHSQVKPQSVNGDITKVNHKEEKPSKRRASEDVETESPLKRLCQEVEKTFPQHDFMINDYIQTATKNNIDEIQRHTEQLLSEIQTLRELAQKKEQEWNNILHLKKVKEEILLRLLRRKQVLSFEKAPEVNGSDRDPYDYLNQAKNLAIDKSDEISGLAIKQPPSTMTQMMPAPVMPVASHFNPMAGLPPPYDKAHMQMPKPVFPQALMMPGPMPGFPRDPRDMNGQMPGGFNIPMGRQGPTKDVKSIIADYRQRNPDITPRRGRRMKSLINPNMMNTPRPIAPKMDPMNSLSNLNMLFNNLDMNQKAMLERLQQIQAGALPNGLSFKDVLVQFANMQQSAGLIPPGARPEPPPPRPEPPPPPRRRHEEPPPAPKPPERRPSPAPRLPPPPPYPEISLLPVTTSQSQEASVQNSLLHGILTKNCGEITITPVQPTPAEPPPPEKPEEVVQLDDEESPTSEGSGGASPGGSGSGSGSGGRLVIDEGASEPEPPDDAPLCQGCRRRDAQFVCAGCANQWYCSRDCQVAAWDEHSEMCSG